MKRTSLVNKTLNDVTTKINGNIKVRSFIAFILALTHDNHLEQRIKNLSEIKDTNHLVEYFGVIGEENTNRIKMFQKTLKIANSKNLNVGTITYLVAKFNDDEFNTFYKKLEKNC